MEPLLPRSTTVPYPYDFHPIPAVNWTEVTTGFPAAVNGVQTLDAIQVLGIERPFTRLPLSSILRTLRIARRSISTHTARLCPTLWEWSASAGIPSNVVNTWSSWPPWNQSPRIVSNLELLHRLSGEKSKAFQPGNIEENIPDTIPAGAPGFALDKIALETLRAMRENHPPILEVLYLPGCDIAFHAAVRNDLSDLLETDRKSVV